VTLLNFWFLYCPPCRKEFPEFQKLQDEFGPKGLAIVAVDRGDAPEDVAGFLQKQGFRFPVVMGGGDTSPVFAPFKIVTFPLTYLLNTKGQVVYRSVGIDIEGLREALNGLGLN